MTGERANESQLRAMQWQIHRCNYFDGETGNYISKPLSTLSDDAVLSIIKYREIPICADYGEIVTGNGCLRCTGAQRTGCALCGFGIRYDSERFVRLQKTDPVKVKWAFTPLADGGVDIMNCASSPTVTANLI